MATAKEILAVARGELGYKESPAASNKTKYGAWFGLNGHPWCMMFIQWVFTQADAESLLSARTASCGAFMRAAKAAGQWVTSGYKPGDIVMFDFTGKRSKTEHCGIVEKVNGNTLTTIEGNTGTASNANGGAVMRRTRDVKFVTGACRPRYNL